MRYLVVTEQKTPIPPDMVLEKRRLQPGRMLLVDTDEGRIIGDDDAQHAHLARPRVNLQLDGFGSIGVCEVGLGVARLVVHVLGLRSQVGEFGDGGSLLGLPLRESPLGRAFDGVARHERHA